MLCTAGMSHTQFTITVGRLHTLSDQVGEKKTNIRITRVGDVWDVSHIIIYYKLSGRAPFPFACSSSRARAALPPGADVRAWDSVSGFGVQGLGFGVQGVGFGVQGFGFGVQGLGFGIWGLGSGVEG